MPLHTSLTNYETRHPRHVLRDTLELDTRGWVDQSSDHVDALMHSPSDMLLDGGGSLAGTAQYPQNWQPCERFLAFEPDT